MKIQNYREVKGIAAAPGVTMHIVAGPDEKAPTFVMRLFEFEPGAAMPFHAHPWEHEVFVVEGNGSLKHSGGESPAKEGDALTILPNEQHSIRNPGKGNMKIICVVPLMDGKMPGMPVKD
jgi:quercetin dioxygenase-like cupin family protein